MKRAVCFLIFLHLSAPILAADNSTVVMNIKTYIYHSPTCKWAKRCTKNCIKTTKDKAKSHYLIPQCGSFQGFLRPVADKLII